MYHILIEQQSNDISSIKVGKRIFLKISREFEKMSFFLGQRYIYIYFFNSHFLYSCIVFNAKRCYSDISLFSNFNNSILDLASLERIIIMLVLFFKHCINQSKIKITEIPIFQSDLISSYKIYKNKYKLTR